MFRTSVLALAAVVLVCSCSTGLRIVDHGFSATDLGEGHWAAKFDSMEVASKEEAEANFMVFSARWTIDHGALYFVVEDLTIDGETKVALDRGAPSTATSPSLGGGGSPQSPVSDTQSAVGTGHIEKHHVARGTIRISRERPAATAGQVYEASRVLDHYAGAPGMSKANAGVRVGNGVSP
jgi:hypothetical protein